MRSRRSSFLLASAVALLAATAASAGTLTNASWFQVTQGVPMTRTNAQLGASGSSTATSIAVTLSYPFFSTQFFVPKTPNGTLDLHIFVSQGGPQSITATPSMASGSPGVPGTVVVMTAGHIGMGLNQSMFKVGINTLVQVPLSAGKAGQFTGTFTVVGALHTITVDFYAWTPHTLIFTGLTTKGAALPTVTAAGSFNLTANGGGTVTLVSPSKISIDGALAQRRTAGFTTLVLSFIPEPGTLLLLGAGALGLLLVGSRKP
jgi:threonine dehydrogenase-like Zn-dependent dehydrogenase